MVSNDSKKRSISRRDFVRTGATAGLGGTTLGTLAACEIDGQGSEGEWDLTADVVNFFMNQEPYRRASIMLTGRNFGTGSSRSSGVTWPMAMGIRVVIAPSFGPIFYTNAFRYGLLAVPLGMEVVEGLAEWVESHQGVEITVDLEQQIIVAPGLQPVRFEVDGRVRRKLLEGLDDLEEIAAHTATARSMRSDDRSRRPWVYQTSGNNNR